jgi:hypothetical protein
MKTLGLILFISIVLASCKKEGAAGGGISQVTSLPTVSASDNDAIQTLLQSNNFSGKNQVFFLYQSSMTESGNTEVPYQVAEATQTRNGLPIFYSTLNYVFQSGSLLGLSGKVYGATSLNAQSSQTLPILKELFITEAVNKQGINASYKDSCYVAQFGYYNINLNNAADTTASLIKAWEIHPRNSAFPQCYVRDDNGSTIYFDSGLRPFYDLNQRKN